MHGSQTNDGLTFAIGMLQSGSILYVNVIYGKAIISFKNSTISSNLQDGWGTGFVIY